MEQKTVYNVSDVCKMLNIGSTTVYQLLNQRVIPSKRLGRRYIIPVQLFDEWLNEKDENQ